LIGPCTPDRVRLRPYTNPFRTGTEGALAAFRTRLPDNVFSSDQKAIRFVVDTFAMTDLSGAVICVAA
jgi:hypothetical protein